MALVNCWQCGALFFTYRGGRTCGACLQAEEDAFEAVVAYLRESRERSIPRIAEATGVAMQLIVKWLRQKRIQIEVVPGELDCRRCGKSIREGTFCDACRRKLAEEVAESRRQAGQEEVPLLRRKHRLPPAPTPAEQAARSRGMHYRAYDDS